MEAAVLLAGLGGIAYVINKGKKEGEPGSAATGTEQFTGRVVQPTAAPKAANTAGHVGAGMVTDHIPVLRNSAGHNNMVPFHNKSGTARYSNDVHTSTLDKYSGFTSDAYMHKQEQEYFGEIRPDATNPIGMPVRTDFMQSRVEAPVRMGNYFPVERIHVGPGLGKGYSNEGTGGFHQTDMLNYAMPKTTDELRIADNPKLSYTWDPVPGKHYIQNRAEAQDLPKNRPETFFENGPDRWITTMGVEKGEKLREEIILKEQNRESTDVAEPHYGPAQSAAAGYQSYIRPLLEPFMQFFKLTVGDYFGTPFSYATGGAGNTDEAYRRGKQNLSREMLQGDAARAPVAHGDKTYTHKEERGSHLVKKIEEDRFKPQVQQPTMPRNLIHKSELGSVHYKPEIGQDIQAVRQLDAAANINQLQSNPYYVGLDAGFGASSKSAY